MLVFFLSLSAGLERASIISPGVMIPALPNNVLKNNEWFLQRAGHFGLPVPRGAEASDWLQGRYACSLPFAIISQTRNIYRPSWLK